MFTIYVSKIDIPEALRKKHAEEVKRWNKDGCIGLKPKLYQTAEAIFLAGLHNSPLPPKRHTAISKGDK